ARTSPSRTTLSLHDALPIFDNVRMRFLGKDRDAPEPLEEARARRSFTKREIGHIDPIGAPERLSAALARLEVFAECMNRHRPPRSEEHTSELQSRENLVCRL